MKIISSLIDLVGKTPMIELTHLLPEGSAQLFAKLEMMNPGGSIKDRPALSMILAAEASGELKPGMKIVEPTAGNTGIGLAFIGRLRGYQTVFFVPDRMSTEKILSMRLYGAEVHLIPSELGMKGCIEQASTYAEEEGNCYIPQQFTNEENPRQAEEVLGGEIAEQLNGIPHGIAIGAGTGGTFTGLARWLKNNRPEGQCYLVQPVGSVFKGGERGSYQIEGIGNSFIPKNLVLDLADEIIDVPDLESFRACRLLAETLGLLVGGSAGANFVAAKQLCQKLGSGHQVVTVFPDHIERYASKEWVQKLADGAY